MKTYVLTITENNGVRIARTLVIDNGLTTQTFEYELDTEEQKYIVPIELDDWQTEHVGNRPVRE